MQSARRFWIPFFLVVAVIVGVVWKQQGSGAFLKSPSVESSTATPATVPAQPSTSTTVDPSSPQPPTRQPDHQLASPTLPPSVLINVPFTAQAPEGNWSDPLEQDGCEETSLIMAKYWISGAWLTKPLALKEILDASAWEKDHLNGASSLSVADTIRLAKEYFKFTDVAREDNITIEDIKGALAKGRIVIVPLNGQLVGNPYYTAPGPVEHMLVIRGYDDTTGQFITNDPGTRHGELYRYSYQTLYAALREYQTGYHVPVTVIKKTMITIGR